MKARLKKSSDSTQLIEAVKDGSIEDCKTLIEAGANVRCKDSIGFSPVHWAAFLGYQEIMELLIQAGLEINLKDADGYTPLHWGSYRGHANICQWLINKGADVRMRIPAQGDRRFRRNVTEGFGGS